MTQGKYVLGFAAIVCLWLVASVHGADSELFEAAQLERFPRAIPMPEVSQTRKAKKCPCGRSKGKWSS
jgi:hypothetical protein